MRYIRHVRVYGQSALSLWQWLLRLQQDCQVSRKRQDHRTLGGAMPLIIFTNAGKSSIGIWCFLTSLVKMKNLLSSFTVAASSSSALSSRLLASDAKDSSRCISCPRRSFHLPVAQYDQVFAPTVLTWRDQAFALDCAQFFQAVNPILYSYHRFPT